MKKQAFRYRLGAPMAALCCIAGLMSPGVTQAHECDEFQRSPCADFCVGSNCGSGDPQGHIDDTPIPAGDANDLTLEFHLDVTMDSFPSGASVKVFQITDLIGAMVLEISVERDFAGTPFYMLKYRSRPLGVVGTLTLGGLQGGPGEHWVVHRRLGLFPKITVTRSSYTNPFGTGVVPLAGNATLIKQGVLQLLGYPSGEMSQSQAEIH